MKKVVIIGNGGSGKSTLAVLLSSKLDLPVFHLDQLIWNSNWQAVSEIEFIQRHDLLISSSQWIIEGIGYDCTIESRFIAADTIIFLDFSLSFLFYRVFKRQVQSLYKEPAGWAPNNKLFSKTAFILRIVTDIHRNTRKDILALISKHVHNTEILHIKNLRMLRNLHTKLGLN
ncbi:hypothetical protein KCM76_09065 [Zooshikella marina]|uniref:hypothetical protein n=1 Tax=Zooshikella ganghwensis TaxID=202772 RepID=UPI001BAFE582|nr:hypothetical protein [Zooshikella ganghwensis]MBU2706134.1 hypothetical protein [Zooshikella ganghwensis]